MPDASRPLTPPRSAIDIAFLTNDPDAGEVVLVRHGEQDVPTGPGERFALYIDPPLSGRGLRQAEAVGRALADEPIDAVYSSDLRRAIDTGRAIARHHDLDVTVIGDLREIEMFRDLPPDRGPVDVYGIDRMRKARDDFALTRRWSVYPSTETGEELSSRIVPAVEDILAKHPGQRVVVACHGGVINSYLTHVLRLTAEDMFFRPAHASVHRVVFARDRRVVATLNEIHYLPDADDLLSW